MLESIANALQRAATPRRFWLLLVAYGGYFPIFFFADVPFGLRRITPYAQGAGILDVETFYTADQAYQRLALFGEQGRAVYGAILLGDLIYPGLLGAFLAVTITLLYRALRFKGRAWPFLGLLPLANMLCDYTENALVLTLLGRYPERWDRLAAFAGMVTFAKSMFGLASFVALGLGIVLYLVRRVRRT